MRIARDGCSSSTVDMFPSNCLCVLSASGHMSKQEPIMHDAMDSFVLDDIFGATDL